MPQAIQIETQAEQQGLPHLHRQTAAWGASRELAFDRREDALDQCATPVELLWKGSPHLGTHSVHAPSFLSTLGGDNTLRSELLPNVGVISLAVEFASASTSPMRVCWEAVLTTAGKFAQSFHGPRRAVCDNKNC
jgi:hypothetical protein